jgi:hypothetical protein
MHIKIALLSLVLLSACHAVNSKKVDSADSNTLSTSLVNNPNTPNGLDTSMYNNKPTMDFTDTLHDFGNITQGETVVYEFEFTNHGKTPLIISNASASCGCTLADYPHDPVLAGKSGKLRAIFNTAGKAGHQEKSIAITTNSKRGIEYIYIKANVDVVKGAQTY